MTMEIIKQEIRGRFCTPLTVRTWTILTAFAEISLACTAFLARIGGVPSSLEWFLIRVLLETTDSVCFRAVCILSLPFFAIS